MNPARQGAALLALNNVPLRVFAVALAQIGSVASTFGMNREFSAIAAAVLGGTSLFRGRGRVWPGTAFGAVLIQAVENGLHNANADPYCTCWLPAGSFSSPSCWIVCAADY